MKDSSEFEVRSLKMFGHWREKYAEKFYYYKTLWKISLRTRMPNFSCSFCVPLLDGQTCDLNQNFDTLLLQIVTVNCVTELCCYSLWKASKNSAQLRKPSQHWPESVPTRMFLWTRKHSLHLEAYNAESNWCHPKSCSWFESSRVKCI